MLIAALVSLLSLQDTAGAARVFLDCPSTDCHVDYLRTEIRFVDWVRDRQVADVHVLVTTQDAGSGTEYTITFIGLRAFASLTDTLRFSTSNTDTDDEERSALARWLRLGLVRYVSHTPLAASLIIRSGGDDDAPRAPRGRDPWNYWVFEIGVSASFNGEESVKDRNLSAEIEARRVTEAWKWELELGANGSRTAFKVEEDSVTDSTIVARRNEWNFDGLMVRSLGQHWSAGALAEAGHSSFRNVDFVVRGGPAVEFNVFPYRESTRRILTARYAAGFEHSRYIDTTIYDRLRETRPLHNLEVSLELRQPWGSSDVSLDFTQYLHDLGKINLGFNASADIRLVRGLELNVYGGYEVIRSQLYLSKEDLSPEDVLTRRRALATAYSYYTGFGISFTFGSIYNNVVNPRM